MASPYLRCSFVRSGVVHSGSRWRRGIECGRLSASGFAGLRRPDQRGDRKCVRERYRLRERWTNPLTLVRYYNSAAGIPRGSFGNWRSNYDASLFAGATEVDLTRPDGKAIIFYPDGHGGWGGLSDLSFQLTQSGSNWILTDENDNVETYKPTGPSRLTLLTTIKARDGYVRTVAYAFNSAGATYVSSVTDTFGRKLTFTHSSSGSPLVTSVATPDGLVLKYVYGGSLSNLEKSSIRRSRRRQKPTFIRTRISST